jgi:cytochrome c peroxidase
VRRWGLLLGIALAVGALLVVMVASQRGNTWTAEERATLEGLWLGSLEPLPADPSNRYADDPRAAELGHRLFFDSRFSANGEVACASCHSPGLNFTDGLPLSKGVGAVSRKSMTITGTAYSPWLFWDGRKDSQWAQALAPFESPVEHGIDRGTVAQLVHEHYRGAYEALFGILPELDNPSRFPVPAGPVDNAAARANWERVASKDQEAVTRVFVNVGKAIAAYERRIVPGPSRFDRYVEALLDGDADTAETALVQDEIAGLRLFIGKAHCTDCHNGPLLTNNDFHNTGVPARAELPQDLGRALGARQALEDEFNCLSPYSDAGPGDCAELRFLKLDDHQLERAFKPPTLRNVEEAAPYMHAGQFATLRDVLEHYNRAPEAPAGHSELGPLNLSDRELEQLEAFLRSLSGPLQAPEGFLSSPHDP